MTFTDDDLKRLKEDMQGDPEEDIYRGKKNILCFDEMNALLARLEAAEKLNEVKSILLSEFNVPDSAEEAIAEEAWREVAGK